ncbi:MAG: hypothetical protein GF309_02200, partial [Candidatus Lokiarchaeota archaeon]|nr:hypothetical protein [Candidatus Lokiarchaeota archaeon]
MSTASHSPVTCGYEQHTLWYPDTQVKPKQKKPWSTFVRKDIRLFGNNKTHRTPKDKEHGRRNITKIGPLLDSVRGCPLTAVYGGRGCYGHCYLAENMARYHIKHWIPVPNRFNGQLLAKDLERLEWDYVRNGVMGDPSLD